MAKAKQRKKLFRSKDDRVLTGLAGGLGDYFDLDPTLVRIGLIILEFATAGLLIFGYLIVSIFVPSEKR